MHSANTNTYAASAELQALVTRLVDEDLAARIEAINERDDLSRSQRIAWIASALALRSGLVTDLMPKVQRLIDEPGAPSVTAQ